MFNCNDLKQNLNRKIKTKKKIMKITYKYYFIEKIINFPIYKTKNNLLIRTLLEEVQKH